MIRREFLAGLTGLSALGFIPALVNINVGSSLMTIGADGTIWCPFDSKKLLKESLISLAVIMSLNILSSS